MDYLRKCTKCGRYMVSKIVSTAHVKWICVCGNVVHTGCAEIEYDNKTTYTGGGASGRTVIK